MKLNMCTLVVSARLGHANIEILGFVANSSITAKSSKAVFELGVPGMSL